MLAASIRRCNHSRKPFVPSTSHGTASLSVTACCFSFLEPSRPGRY
jgi:hypothetical protein